jgi:hypothetical protein
LIELDAAGGQHVEVEHVHYDGSGWSGVVQPRSPGAVQA